MTAIAVAAGLWLAGLLGLYAWLARCLDNDDKRVKGKNHD